MNIPNFFETFFSLVTYKPIKTLSKMSEKTQYFIGRFTLDRYFPIEIAMVPSMDHDFFSKNVKPNLNCRNPKEDVFDLGDDDMFIVFRDEIIGFSIVINSEKLDVRKKIKIALTVSELIQVYYSGIPMSNKDIVADISYFIDRVYTSVSEKIIINSLKFTDDSEQIEFYGDN